ncbi:MAG: DUF3108 domain-containing protein [Bacteroidota bacterium]
MRITLLVSVFIFTFHVSPVNSFSQRFNPVKNEAFIRGEKLKFRAYYDSYVTGKVSAGIATLEVDHSMKQIDSRKVYHIVGEGRSKGAFNWFFKVEDRFESFVDEEYLFSWSFIRRTREGDFKYSDDVKFNQYSGTALSTRANKKIPAGTQDVLSAFYYARTLDLSDIKPGQNIPIAFYLDDSLYISQIQFIGREEVITDLGRFQCLRFKPMVATGNVFSQPYPMDVWITEDKNHLPILAKSAVIVGSVKLELISYSGLANPLTSQVLSKEK